MTNKEQLHAKVLERKNELIQLVSDLIKINSENPIGEQHTVTKFIQDYLSRAGIATEIVGPNPEYPCLLAKIGTDDGFSIILNGHVDVVPAGDLKGWKFDPFGGEITETQIRGRGTSDMKAGVAGVLFTMMLLQESGAEMKGNIRLHIVSDEETGGQFGTEWLCKNGYADGGCACLVAEPTSFDNIEIGQKGMLHTKLIAHGEPAHGSLGNYKGDNAIIKLSKVLIHINDLTRVPGHFLDSQAKALENSKKIAAGIGIPGVENVIDHLTANVGIIHGGNKINMVPDCCECQIDMRLPVGIDHQEVEDAVHQLIRDSSVEGVDAEFEWLSNANYTDMDSEIVKYVHKNAEAIWGNEVLPAYQWASSDAKHYRDLGIPTIQYGPSNNAGIHSYNEDVDIEDVVHSAEIYMLSMCDMLGIQ